MFSKQPSSTWSDSMQRAPQTDDLETSSFLGHGISNVHLSKLESRYLDQGRPKRLFTSCAVSLALNVIVLLMNVMIWQTRAAWGVRLVSDDFTRDALEMELRPFDDIFGRHYGKFLGDPRPELDEAWGSLLHGYNLRVPAHVPIMPPTGNNTIVELTDGSGDHYAVLAVLHEIHCLKTIRQYLFPDYYPETWEMFKPGPAEMIGDHMDHCFDILRQASMCHADMTLLAVEWWPGEGVPQNIIHTPHLCANWDHLSNWAVEHSFDPWGTGLVEPPWRR